MRWGIQTSDLLVAKICLHQLSYSHIDNFQLFFLSKTYISKTYINEFRPLELRSKTINAQFRPSLNQFKCSD